MARHELTLTLNDLKGRVFEKAHGSPLPLNKGGKCGDAPRRLYGPGFGAALGSRML